MPNRARQRLRDDARTAPALAAQGPGAPQASVQLARQCRHDGVNELSCSPVEGRPLAGRVARPCALAAMARAQQLLLQLLFLAAAIGARTAAGELCSDGFKCSHGGTCEDKNGEASCTCAAGYSGPHCGQQADPCDGFN